MSVLCFYIPISSGVYCTEITQVCILLIICLLGENDLSLDTRTSVFCLDMSVCKESKNNLCNLVERASAAS
jgi:hypothetical protein